MTEKFRSMVIHAVKSVIAQGEQSNLPNSDSCAYRGENGKKCAVGHLISDAAYSAHLENKTINNEQVRKAISLSQEYPLSEGEANILAQIQCAHDYTDRYSMPFVKAFKFLLQKYLPAEVWTWLEPELKS